MGRGGEDERSPVNRVQLTQLTPEAVVTALASLQDGGARTGSPHPPKPPRRYAGTAGGALRLVAGLLAPSAPYGPDF